MLITMVISSSSLTSLRLRLPILLLLFKWVCLVSLLRLVPGPRPARGDWLMDCGNCHCKWNSGKKTADCRNLSLSGVPEYLSSEVQVLDLSQNQILTLEENAFLATQLQNLHKLFIRNSTLQKIIPQSFTQLEILIELDLSNNLLRELLPNVFDCLTKVRALVLNGNLLQTLRGGVFHHLKYLHKIELKHNRLVSIDPQAFLDVPLLSQIYLDGNQFRVLHRETFQSLNRLTALSLDQNPWNCTCDLQEFRDFVLKMNLYTPPTACHYPLQLRSMLWIEDQPEAFACKPKIVYPARGASINTSKENVTLVCRVHGSPNTVVAWDYNKQLYKSGSTTGSMGSTGSMGPRHPRVHIEMLREEKRSTRDPQFGRDVFTSRLTIVGAEKSDEGVYTCLAENAGGKDAVQMSLVVQKSSVQRDLLLNSNLFVIICLMVLGLISVSVLLSMVTYCIYRRFKHLHLHPRQHTHLRSINFSAQQFSSDAGAVVLHGHGVSNSVVVAGGTEVLLDTFQNQATDRHRSVEPIAESRKFSDLITSIDRNRSPHAIMGYLCNRPSAAIGGNNVASRNSNSLLSGEDDYGARKHRDETLTLERKFKDKLNVTSKGYDLSRSNVIEDHRIMPSASASATATACDIRETAIIRQSEEYQPDVLPSNSPPEGPGRPGGLTMLENNEDQLSQQLMLIGLNSNCNSNSNARSKYNINVQKYLQDKYGSVGTAVRRNNNNISDSRQESASGSFLLYPPKVAQQQLHLQPQPEPQPQLQGLQRHCRSLALPSSQRQSTDSHCRQPSPPPYTTTSATSTIPCTLSLSLSDAASRGGGGGGGGGGGEGVMENMIAAITVTSSSSLAPLQNKLTTTAVAASTNNGSASRKRIL
ncbi:uncharacterized protein kek4 isoform X2 [Drosophila pseudoobscura]|nr:uncharacterized protein LOC6901036 isoform X2 [Drosophila pseudoobscura]